MSEYFYCYSYRLMYFIKANGINYIRYGFNRNNGLKYFVFTKTNELNLVLDKWNKFKEEHK